MKLTPPMDWNFIKSIFDPREIIFPFTLRKLFFFLFYALLIAAVVAVETNVGFFDYLVHAVKSNLIPLMAVLYGFEPLLMLVTMAFTKYPDKLPEISEKPPEPADVEIQLEEENTQTAIKAHNKKMAVIIVAHNSSLEIEATLRAYLKIVEPEQIYIIDNGNSEQPTDNTLSIAKSVSERINYYWHNRGNKTVAQFIGLILAQGDHREFALMSDDDVHPPSNFKFNESLLENEKFKGIFYPIMAISKKEKPSRLVQFQSIEYKQADHFKMFEDRFHGVLYPHGAIALWKISVLLRTLLTHSTRFIAEDLETGIRAARLGYRQRFDANYVFPTEVPTTVLGPDQNLYKQRARGWCMGIHTMNFELLRNFFTEWNLKPADVAALKASQMYTLYNNYVDWTRLLVMIISASDPTYWGKLAAVIAGQQAMTMFWHYAKLRNRPDLQHDFLTLATMFFYRLLLTAFTNIGLLRLLLVYLPNLSPAKTIEELLKSGEFKNLKVELPEFLASLIAPSKEEAKPENAPSFKDSLYSFFWKKPISKKPSITIEEVVETKHKEIELVSDTPSSP
ncbi:Glycosyl transferase family 2 [Legionella quinlivanii]|uniref:Glycosyl transferase family 2 n=1 Tax=Legionella quinlivanii TaxID=45073 RepID=A0A0W0Y4J5_9GAMM|nr:glycosyltransferase family 2 protein [Legionella quinlivanii]KTD51733.1 Glycosyl transferase family 2 [Legionella quinlivanii]SEF64596.1 Glycosyltransferase, catalytic subunit of cellulose synthase and poly-beta-1,6-N-acetylglucosamine synthase [Legionella quinlivanii DSM 21216]STY10739.1 poly-beta-1,6 N-acetyl-D-glucosamine synthase [Legionella quinlivanii]